MKSMVTIAAAGAFLLLAACGKKDGPGPKPAPEYDVYMAGFCKKEKLEKIACYWKNGERVELSDGTKNSECSSITASDGSVYISGTYDLYTPCYWKDGRRFDLDDRHYSTRSITVDNGSVYVLNGGFYWKDNEIVDIENYPDFSANAMVVADGRVYAGGRNRGQNIYAASWTDGRLVLLPLPEGSPLSDLTCGTASGGSVYFGGLYLDKEEGVEWPCYWQDGMHVPLDVPQGAVFASVKAICVADGKVYAAGTLAWGIEGGCYWVDGKPELLDVPVDLNEFHVTGIAVAGGKVYVSGAYNSCEDHKTHACYWVDGKRIDMPMEDDVEEMKSFGIALVEK